MRYFSILLASSIAATGVTASSWFPGTKSAYNKWHETELERWLSDNDIPHPAAADRKGLESLVEKNWNSIVVEPYQNWDISQLNSFIQSKSKEGKADIGATKDSLVSQVKSSWYETEENTQQGWSNVKDWILDTWSDSQLKSFCDKNGIPVPQPRQRDTLLQKARAGYETVAKKAGETVSYPGNWLYATWSDSDLKAWLDSNGFPAPQPSTRDKLVASVRRNSRLAYLKAQQQIASASSSARAAYATLSDTVLDTWGESQLKDFCDKNSVSVPQGTKLNELRALVRKKRAEVLGDTVVSSASSAFGAATSNAQNQFAKASDSASLAAQDIFNQATGAWSESRLKAFLDARGVPVPQGSSKDQLVALVRKHAHKASSGWSAWTFDDFSYDNLKDYMSKNGDELAKAAAKKKDVSRDELVKAAQSAYSAASTAGGSNYASATNYLASATAAITQQAFGLWSETELKAYLDSYGIPVPQGSNVDALRALARRQSTYFKYGTSSPGGTIAAKLGETAKYSWKWIANQLSLGSEAAQENLNAAGSSVKSKVKEAAKEL